MTTDLNPEGLEKAARAIHGYPDATWRNETTRSKSYYRDKARAAITAYLGHTTVTTVEELDALPVGAILRDSEGTIWETGHEDGIDYLCRVGHEDGYGSWEVPLPATVIHRPTPSERRPTPAHE